MAADDDATRPVESNWTDNPIEATADHILEPGSALGRYEIESHLGTGGMGTVYRAFDRKLERPVALKLLRSSRGAQRTERLVREAQALAKLSHPNIVAVYDVDAHNDQVFVAMELVEGVTLRDWLKARPRSTDQIASAFIEAGRGLAAAHKAGIVHRDFKPSNVMLGDDGRVRVLDFGLARIDPAAEAPSAGPSVGSAGPLTRTGSVMGTPAYMSPEQHRGEPAGEASDQFSFCLSLYEALYGEHPFAGETRVDMAARIMEGALRPAPVGADVPPRMRAALLRGMAPSAHGRFDSMASLLEELGPPPRRSRRLALWLGGAAVVLGTVSVTLWAARGGADRGSDACSAVNTMLAGVWDPEVRAAVAKATAANSPAVLERLDDYALRWTAMRMKVCKHRDEAHAERVLCLETARVALEETGAALARGAPGALSRIDPIIAALPSLATCDRPAGAVGWHKPPASDADAAERARLSVMAQRLGSLRGVGDQKAARALSAELIAALATARDPYARAEAARMAAIMVSDHEKAIALLRGAVKDAIASRHELGVVKAYADLGGRLLDAKRWDEAVRELEIGEAHNQRLALFVKAWPGMQHWTSLLAGRFANLRGLVERRQHRHEASITHFERAARHWETVADRYPGRLAMALNNQADAQQIRGRYRPAVAALTRAIELHVQRNTDNPYDRIIMLMNRGIVHIELGDNAAAKRDFEEASRLAGDRPVAGTVLWNAVVLQLRGGELDAASKTLARVRQAWKGSIPDASHYWDLLALRECELARRRGQLGRARKLCSRVTSALPAKIGAGDPFVALAQLERARVELQRKRSRSAIALCQQALTTLRQVMGDQTVQVALARITLGRALLARGARDRANEAFEQAIAVFEALKLETHDGLLAARRLRASAGR